MAHCMGHIMRKKRQAENEKMNEDLRNDREALDAEMETRYFEMAQGPAIGSVMADSAVVDLVMGRLQSEGGFSVGLIDELRKTLDTVPVRFWVVDNSGSMLAKDLIKGTDITKGLQKKKESRWEEMKLMLSFLADFVEALGARTDIHFLNQPGATQSGLLDIEEFDALQKFFTGGGRSRPFRAPDKKKGTAASRYKAAVTGVDKNVRAAFEYYDTNSSRRLSAAELLPALRDLMPVQGQQIDFNTATNILHQFNGEDNKGKPLGQAVLDLSALPPQFLTLSHHGYPSLPAYGTAAHKAALLKSLGPKPTLGTPLHLRVREVIKMVRLIAPDLKQSGQLAAVVIWTDGKPDNGGRFAAALRELQSLPTIVTVRLCTDVDDVLEYYDKLDDGRSAASTQAAGAIRSTLDVVDDLLNEALEVREVHPWLTYGAPIHMLREFGMPNPIFDKLDEHKMTPEQMRSVLQVIFGATAALPEPIGDELEWPWAPISTVRSADGTGLIVTKRHSRTYSTLESWAPFLDALKLQLAVAPMVADPARNMISRPWVDVTKLSVAYGPNFVLRLGGAGLPKNAYVVAERAQASAEDDAVLGSTEKMAMAGRVDLSTEGRIEVETFTVHSHSAADSTTWPDLRLPRAALPDSAQIVLHVFAWGQRDPDRRVLGAKPTLVGTTEPLTIGEMRSGTDLSVGKVALRLDEVSERSAYDQDVREKAAWDAVDAESRRRVAGRLPHGWTLEKKGRERTIYINPKGSKTYSRPELKSQSCVLL